MKRRGFILSVLIVALLAVSGLGIVRADVPGRGNAWGHMGNRMGGLWNGLTRRGPGGFMHGNGICPFWGATTDAGDPIDTLDETQAAVEAYIADLGLSDLVVSEVMAFELNSYAIVAEADTGIGAMELLIDRETGRVTPEPGPNMMWNTRYGMHGGGMMGWAQRDTDMTVTPEQAEAIAQAWLDTAMPGHTAGGADAFYGYYTLHFLHDGEIVGMLSVHGNTGDVWYHSWHGAFIEMSEHAD